MPENATDSANENMSEKASDPADSGAIFAVHLGMKKFQYCRRKHNTSEDIQAKGELVNSGVQLKEGRCDEFADDICRYIPEDLIRGVDKMVLTYIKLPMCVTNNRSQIEAESILATLLKSRVEEMFGVTDVEVLTEWKMYENICFSANLKPDSVPVPRSRFAIVRFDDETSQYAIFENGSLKCDEYTSGDHHVNTSIIKIISQATFDRVEQAAGTVNRVLQRTGCAHPKYTYPPFTVLIVGKYHDGVGLGKLRNLAMEKETPIVWKMFEHSNMTEPAFAATFYEYCKVAEQEKKDRLVPLMDLMDYVQSE